VVSLNHSREVDGAPEVIRARCALNASQRRKISVRSANTITIEPNLDTKFQGKIVVGSLGYVVAHLQHLRNAEGKM
jgi:hypothetical protein